MQRWGDDHPVWDLVLCIGAGIATFVCFFWATLLLNPYVPVPIDRRLASLACIIMAALMLSSAVGYWRLWKVRH